MRATNIVVLAVVAALLIVLIAQLRSPTRVPVVEQPAPATQNGQGEGPQIGRFDAAQPSLEDGGFQHQLLLSELTSRWMNLGLPPDLPQAVADGRLGGLTVQLDNVAGAGAGNHQANFVLAELESFCDDVRAHQQYDAEPLIRAAQSLKPEETAYVRTTAGWMSWLTDQLYKQCRDAVFDSIAIESRLRTAAAEGHTPSQWRLGLTSADPGRSYRDVLDAALAGYVPAELTIANYFPPVSLPLFAGQNVRGSRSIWLQQVAKDAVIGHALLGECYRLGCDGGAPAPARAAEHYIEAARSGIRMAERGLSTLADSHPDVVAPTQAYAWRVFSRRLNETGCYGGDYLEYYIEDSHEMPVLYARLGERNQKIADDFAQQFWAQYATEARDYLGCMPT
jgi:hypothetical protein